MGHQGYERRAGAVEVGKEFGQRRRMGTEHKVVSRRRGYEQNRRRTGGRSLGGYFKFKFLISGG